MQISCFGDNRNTEDITVSVGFYLIGKNPKGVYQLLLAESTSATMKKFSKKTLLAKVNYSYHDYRFGARKKSNEHFEYRGCLVVVRGPDGKVITVEGEYAKLYTFIESKSKGDTFDSKGNEKTTARFR